MESTRNQFEIGKFGIVLGVWGLIGLAIAFYFSLEDSKVRSSVTPVPYNTYQHFASDSQFQTKNQFGPIIIKKPGTVYDVEVSASLPSNHWSFVEVVVTDSYDDYMYSFGQELWHESGKDSEGHWTEKRTEFESSLTFPQTGEFYLNFVTNSKRNREPKRLNVTLVKKNGSAMLHFWLAILVLVVAIICIEIQYSVIQNTLEAMSDDD